MTMDIPQKREQNAQKTGPCSGVWGSHFHSIQVEWDESKTA
jgi:hypothetical protein